MFTIYFNLPSLFSTPYLSFRHDLYIFCSQNIHHMYLSLYIYIFLIIVYVLSLTDTLLTDFYYSSSKREPRGQLLWFAVRGLYSLRYETWQNIDKTGVKQKNE